MVIVVVVCQECLHIRDRLLPLLHACAAIMQCFQQFSQGIWTHRVTPRSSLGRLLILTIRHRRFLFYYINHRQLVPKSILTTLLSFIA